jgi:hypothetical protein
MINVLKPQWKKENNKDTFRIPAPTLPEGEGAETELILVLIYGKRIMKIK